MKVFFDTSVLVAAIVESHPMHPRAFVWLKRAKSSEIQFVTAGHVVAELYAVLTSLPVKPRISPGTAWRLTHENVATVADIITLGVADYRATIKRLSERGVTGGAVYDGLIAAAAAKAGAERLLTLNARDFARVWPEASEIIAVP